MPHPGQACQPAILGGVLQRLDGLDAQLVIDARCHLGAHARDTHEPSDPLGKLGAKAIEVVHVPGVEVLGDLERQGITHAGDRAQLTRARHLSDVRGQMPDGARCILISPHSKAALAFQLQQLGDLFEHIGHGLVRD